MATLKNTTISDTGFQKLPAGTTAQRPANPAAGMIRFNTDQGFVEWYDDVVDDWLPISEFVGVVASGGTVTDIEQDGQLFRVHTFTSSGTFDVIRGGDVEYLVVAGGGGGGGEHGGGGGAGGMLDGSTNVGVGTMTITVGSGGASGGFARPPNPVRGGQGGASALSGVTSATGGGGGGGRSYVGGNGGSGGGGGSTSVGGTGVTGQGFAGGVGANEAPEYNGGGGGGAGEVGTDAQPQPSPGNGGDGHSSTITGELVFYAGGGGGCALYSSTGFGAGGLGGGGRGATTTALPVAGTNGLGGGGGGANRFASGGNHQSSSIGPAGLGGSGIVIVRYRIG